MTIQEMLASDDYDTYLSATRQLDSVSKPQAVSILTELANSSDHALQLRAINQLRKHDPLLAKHLALKAIKNPTFMYHADVLYNLYKLEVNEAIPEVRNIILTHPDPIVRSWSALYLGEFGRADEIPILERSMRDPGEDHEGRTIASIATESIRMIKTRQTALNEEIE